MLYSLEKLKVISNGNEGFIKGMVHVFGEETPINIDLFEKFKSSNDFTKLGQLVHKLKPSINMCDIHSL